MVGSLDYVECGVGIDRYCLLRIGHVDYDVVRSMDYLDRPAEGADIGIDVEVAHFVTEGFAISAAEHVAKAPETSSEAPELIHHGNKIGNVEGGVEEYQSLQIETLVFGCECRHESPLA